MNENITTKTTLINIDSSFRNINPKNILYGFNINTKYIQLKKDSKNIYIYFNNYDKDNNTLIKTGDKIIIKNIKSQNLNISNSLYFIKNFNYALIYIPDHNYTDDFQKYNNVSINITDIDYNLNYFKNIPINSLILQHQIYLIQQINLPQEFIDNISFSYEQIKSNFIAIKLPSSFITFNIYDILPNFVSISKTEISSIPIGFFNADYPINYLQRQGSYLVQNYSKNFITITLPSKSYKDFTIQQDNIIIDKIKSQIEGFPDSSNYTIKLKKNLTNVSSIELLSSEIPNNIPNINNYNNKFYWQNLEDGKTIYNITIPVGNYNLTQLTNTIQQLINNTDRINNNTIKSKNIIDIQFNSSSQQITFNFFKQDILSNAIKVDNKTIDSIDYVILEIKHPNNNININDQITISNANDISYIPASVINQTHKVIDVNTSNSTYQIILPSFSQTTVSGTIDNQTVLLDIKSGYNNDNAGGENIKITSKNISRILNNYNDSICSILGFKNIGKEYSITHFNSSISNFDSYPLENNFNLNSVGKTNNTINYLNLTSDIRYILLYINDYEEIITNTRAPNCFAKILLSNNDGYKFTSNDLEFLMNTFVSYPVIFDTPVNNLSQLQITLTYPNGNIINFNNINHSFTLKITEIIYKNPKGKHHEIDSKTINIYKDYKNFLLK